MKKLLIALTVLTVAFPSYAKEEAPVDPGPEPSVELFRQLAEPALLRGFFDPGSAQFQWDRGLVGGYWKPLFSKKIPGWFTCGLVNGKNRMGGYVGFHRFVVVVRNDQIVFSQIGDGSAYDLVAMSCQKAIDQGVMPVANAIAASPPPLSADQPQLGITVTAVPDGGYVGSVVPGSVAEKAAMVPGMVISHLNGVALKGFDQAMIGKMMVSAGDPVVLTIIGKGDVKLTRAPIAK